MNLNAFDAYGLFAIWAIFWFVDSKISKMKRVKK